MFTDPVLFTTLKNAVVGSVLLVPLLVSARQRRRYRTLTGREWSWLLLVAIVGGSVPYALFFTGLKTTTPVTGALGDHLQFVLVVVFAVLVLKERLTATMWAGMAALLVGVLLSLNLGLVRWNGGTALILASTVLFSIEWVIVKHLLRGQLAPLTVMTIKMTLGSLVLFGYLALQGRLAPVAHLTATQWWYALGTGAILLLFTASIFIAIQSVRVSAVMAIGSAAPLVTIALQLATGRHVAISGHEAGLFLVLTAVIMIVVLGIRQESAHSDHVDASLPPMSGSS